MSGQATIRDVIERVGLVNRTDFRNRTNNNPVKLLKNKIVTEHVLTLPKSQYDAAYILDAVNNKEKKALFDGGFKGTVVTVQNDKTVLNDQELDYREYDPQAKHSQLLISGDIVTDFHYCKELWIGRNIVKLWDFDFDTCFPDAEASIENVLETAHRTLSASGTIVSLTFIAVPSAARMRQWENGNEKLKTLAEEMKTLSSLPEEELFEYYLSALRKKTSAYLCVKLESSIFTAFDIERFSCCSALVMHETESCFVYTNPLEGSNGSKMMTVVWRLTHPSDCVHSVEELPVENPSVDKAPTYIPTEREKCLEWMLRNDGNTFQTADIENAKHVMFEFDGIRSVTYEGEPQSKKSPAEFLSVFIAKILRPNNPAILFTMNDRLAVKQLAERGVSYLKSLKEDPTFQPQWQQYLSFSIHTDIGLKIDDSAVYVLLANDTKLKQLVARLETPVSILGADEADLLFSSMKEDLKTTGSLKAQLFHDEILCNRQLFPKVALFTATPMSIYLCDDGTTLQISEKVHPLIPGENYRDFFSIEKHWNHVDFYDPFEHEPDTLDFVMNHFWTVLPIAYAEGVVPQLLINLTTAALSAGFNRMKMLLFQRYLLESIKNFLVLIVNGDEDVSVYTAQFGPNRAYQRFETLSSFYNWVSTSTFQRLPIVILSSKSAGRALSFCNRYGTYRIFGFWYQPSSEKHETGIMQDMRFLGCYLKALAVYIYCTAEVQSAMEESFFTNRQQTQKMVEKEEGQSCQDIMMNSLYPSKRSLATERIMCKVRLQRTEEVGSARMRISQTDTSNPKWKIEKEGCLMPQLNTDGLLEKKKKEWGLTDLVLMTTYRSIDKPDFANVVHGNETTEKFSKEDLNYIKQRLASLVNCDHKDIRMTANPTTRQNYNTNPALRASWHDGSYNYLKVIVDLVEFSRAHFDGEGTDRVHIVIFKEAFATTDFQYEPDKLYVYHTLDGHLNFFTVKPSTGEHKRPAQLPSGVELPLTHSASYRNKEIKMRKKPRLLVKDEEVAELKTYLAMNFHNIRFESRGLMDCLIRDETINAPFWGHYRPNASVSYFGKRKKGQGKIEDYVKKLLKSLVQSGFLAKDKRMYVLN